MKTIEVIKKLVSNIEEYGFSANMVTFQLKLKPSHIQPLIDMGVQIFFDTAVMADVSPKALRFKSGREAINQRDYAPYYYYGNPANKKTCVVENWLNVQAQCSPSVLENLDKYCRDTHLNQVAIHNDTVLRNAGWPFKKKYSSKISIARQYKDIKAIRRTAQGRPYANLLPIQKRVLNLI